MAQATNFTIKDGAASPADVVFTNVQGAGQGVPAAYFARARGLSPATQPVIHQSSKGSKGKRETLTTIRVPYVVTDTLGVPRVVDSFWAEVRVVNPNSLPASVRADGNAFLRHCLDVAQLSEGNETGYAPN